MADLTITQDTVRKSVVHPEYITLPDSGCEHLVGELLSVIELWAGGHPTHEQCEAMQRIAKAIGEESRD